MSRNPDVLSRWYIPFRRRSSRNYEITPRHANGRKLADASMHRCIVVVYTSSLSNSGSKSRASAPPGRNTATLPSPSSSLCVPQTFLFRLSTRTRVFISRARKASECLFFLARIRGCAHSLSFFFIVYKTQRGTVLKHISCISTAT